MAIDKTEPTRAELKARKLEAHIVRRVPLATDVELFAGDTVFVPFEIELRRRGRGELTATIGEVQTPAGLWVLPWYDLTIDVSGKRPVVKGQLTLRAAGDAPRATGEVSVAVEVTDSRRRRRPESQTERFGVTVLAPTPSVEMVDLDRQAFLHFQSAAIEALEKLPILGRSLQLDRVPGPPAAIPEAEGEAFATFQRNRLRADIARSRLRTAADASDPAVAERAVLAIGSLTKRPRGSVDLGGRTTAQNIEAVRLAVENLDVDAAEGLLNALRKKGAVEVGQLGKALRLLGAIHAIRGRQAEAISHFGRALCVQPGLGPGTRRQPILRLFEQVKRAGNCGQRVHIESLEAQRQASPEGLVVVVRVYFGPDPYEVISGGDIEMWGVGGSLIEVKQERAEHGKRPYLEGVFADEGDLENVAGQILIRAMIKSLSGVAVDRRGFPDPVAVQLTERDDIATQGIPWWVWLAGGALVAGGAATALVFLLPGDEVRGIGPVTATF